MLAPLTRARAGDSSEDRAAASFTLHLQLDLL
jgi:hypothetical protein